MQERKEEAVGGGLRWWGKDQLREHDHSRRFQGGFKRSLFPNEFLLGYLHSKQEKEEQLWAGGAKSHCKHQGLMGEVSPGEKMRKLKDKSGQGGRLPLNAQLRGSHGDGTLQIQHLFHFSEARQVGRDVPNWLEHFPNPQSLRFPYL